MNTNNDKIIFLVKTKNNHLFLNPKFIIFVNTYKHDWQTFD